MTKIWGKVIGLVLGWMTGGPLGAVMGLIIGHLHDMHRVTGGDDDGSGFADVYPFYNGNTQQSTFTKGVIVLGAKMAKADGRVTRAEIEAFKRVFRVNPAQEAQVGRLFDQARQSAQGFEPYAFQLAQVFPHIVLEEILGGLFIIAAADSAGISPIEMQYLQRVAAIFGFTADDFARSAARAGINLPGAAKPAGAQDENYAILGVRAEASDDELKTAYRALIREHHPDKLMSQGMPPEFVANAEEKMKRINVAYDTICKSRGIK
jgi:DnaJ like chaperone protein